MFIEGFSALNYLFSDEKNISPPSGAGRVPFTQEMYSLLSGDKGRSLAIFKVTLIQNNISLWKFLGGLLWAPPLVNLGPHQAARPNGDLPV